MEVPRLGVESELQLPACTTAGFKPDSSRIHAGFMPDSSRICDLHRSSWQCWILKLTELLMPLCHSRNSLVPLFLIPVSLYITFFLENNFLFLTIYF